MLNRWKIAAAALLLACAHAHIPAWAQVDCFTHLRIAELPGSEWGTTGPAVGDFDGDGDLDVALSRRETATLYWYEMQGDTGAPEWVRHVAGRPEDGYLRDGLERSLGAAVLDLNDDGWLDLALGLVWFENPRRLAEAPDAPWTPHGYPGRGHDILAVDIDLDGRLDLLTNDGSAVVWFDAAAGLQAHPIVEGLEQHGGTAPRGVGDLDGDGDPDVVIPGRWFENPGGGRGEWKPHVWPHEPIPKASYGPSTRSWVEDLNGDGHPDIIYSDCDTGYSHVYWVENHGGDRWTRHALEDPPGHPETGSFHSLGVADFDLDGDLDVFAGEQEDPDTYMVEQGLLPMKPEGLAERGVVWENVAPGPEPRFEPRVIHEGRPGWHDTVLVDYDGDGDTDLVSKVWHTGGQPYHADLWRNDSPACRTP